MWGYIGFLAASYIYHRWQESWTDPPEKPKASREVDVPKIADGSSLPLIYGRCRVRSPVLAWTSSVRADENEPFGYAYRMDMLMLLGIPVENCVARLWNIWAGELKLEWGAIPPGIFSTDGEPLVGETDHSTGTPPFSGANFPGEISSYTLGLPWNQPEHTGGIGGYVQFYSGRGNQAHVDPVAFTYRSWLGKWMIEEGVSGADIPGFRGYLSVAHFSAFRGLDDKPARWLVGREPRMGAYSYEVSAYPGNSGALNVGVDANPAEVIIDLLTGTFGKLNVPISKIDSASFLAARARLQEEGNGYSRAIEGASAKEIIQEILRQIDGVLFEDPSDGLIKLKLIRGDYAIDDLLHITPANCVGLDGFSAGGWEGIANKIRVVFSDRARDYQDGSATAHNQALAGTTSSEVRELVIEYPGCCTSANAKNLAARELAARSRPVSKCRAIVDRAFRGVNPGDAIKLTWPEYGIDTRVYRVAAVDRGSLENGAIALDLIEDYYYSYRGLVFPDVVNGFPGDLGEFTPLAPLIAPYPDAGGGGLSDGDKGDVTVSGSGSTWTIDAGAVTTTKLANDAVTFAKMQNIATQRLLGRATAGTGDVEELTGTAATALLDLFTSGAKGLVPASGGGTTTYLRADGTFATPPGTGVAVSGLPFLFGHNLDGAVTFDGASTVLSIVPSASVYTLTRDIFCTNITVDGAVTVKTAGFRIYFSGTLTNNGVIDDSGADSVAAGAGTGRGNTNVLFGGASGSAGANNANGGAGIGAANGVFFTGGGGSSAALGGAVAGNGLPGDTLFRGGGGGGASATRTGGNGGTRANQAAGIGGPNLHVLMRGYPDNAVGNKVTFATGGGAGGGPPIGNSGGGGGGGGWMFVCGRVVAGTGVFRAKGGAGGNANGSGGGGGGGGGGGLVVIAYGTRTGSWTTDVAGGAGGAGLGGGGNGGAGASGLAVLMNLSGDGT